MRCRSRLLTPRPTPAAARLRAAREGLDVGDRRRQHAHRIPVLDHRSGLGVGHPQDVADAVIQSIEMPKGEREFRVIVDRLMAVAPRAINDAYEPAQAGLLDDLGQGALKELKK